MNETRNIPELKEIDILEDWYIKIYFPNNNSQVMVKLKDLLLKLK